MFEALGQPFWSKYFQCIQRNLKPDGKALIQTIVIRDDLYLKYRKSTDFIRQNIFPGGALPSPTEFKKTAFRSGLKTAKEYYFGKDYAETIKNWMKNYLNNRDILTNLGFDNYFNRQWLFYLSYCEAGFRSGNTNVVQFELTKI